MKKKTEKLAKPWSGRFREEMAKSAEEYSSSIHFDKRLYHQDIQQSIAYAKALFKCHILTGAECKKIVKVLESILDDINAGKIKLKHELEDIHMNLESLLTERIGEVGKKLHSGRSRNDQVSTDLRMYLKEEIGQILSLLKELELVIVNMADENIKVIMPGYTHLQRAQPVLFSHYLMAYYEMFERDRKRMQKVFEEADVMPLGSGALAGTNFDLDRDFLAKELGFNKISKNSIDAVSDRDYLISFLGAAALIMMHLSRLAEEIILWSTYEFSFIELSDQYTTGSSIMPQKKNPDIAELVRGKTARVYGSLISLLALMKGLPLAYNRDLQEDKEGVFDAIDTLKASLKIFREMLETTRIHKEDMEKASKKGFLTATDLAFYLVKRGVPFREAHTIVGKIVAYCEESNMQLEYLSLQQLKQFSEQFSYDVTRHLSTESSVASKDLIGGTAPRQVKEAIKRAKKDLLHA